MKKTLVALAMLLVLCLAASFVPVTAGAAEAVSKWDGTTSAQLTTEDANTYLINSAADLAKFAAMVNAGTNFSGKTVKLTTDIVWNEGDASTWKADSTGLKAWTSIGTWGKPFAGTFDGQGHTVSGLWGVYSGDNQGFFGNAGSSGCVIKNLAVVNSKLFCTRTGNSNANLGFIGVVQNAGVTLQTLYVDVDFESGGNYVGGLIGNAHGGGASWNITIENCAYAGTAGLSTDYGYYYVGGMIGGLVANNGIADTLTINNSVFLGQVRGYASIGAFFGGGSASNAQITLNMTDNMAHGTVVMKNGGWSAGTLCGNTNSITTKNVTNYFYGNVIGRNDGILGNWKDPTTYFATLTTDTLKAAGFENWVRTEEAGILPASVATLLGYADADAPFSVPAYEYKPDLSKASVYNGTKSTALEEDKEKMTVYINSAADLALFASNVTNGTTYRKYKVVLTTDIVWNTGDADAWAAGTATPTYLWECGKWGKAFYGTFDGQGHVISGLYSNFANDNCGFIGLAWGSEVVVKNLAIVNSTFLNSRTGGNANMGGVVGTAGESTTVTISNVYTDINLKTAANQVGGLIGRVHQGSCDITIENVVVNGSIQGGDCVGGFVGNTVLNNKSDGAPIKVTNAINLASVEGAKYVGGIVGHTEKNGPVLTNVISAGKVTCADAATCGSLLGASDVVANCATIAKSAVVKGVAPSAGAELTAGFATVTVADITGAKASATLTDFDFTAAWVTGEGAAPMPANVMKLLKGELVPAKPNPDLNPNPNPDPVPPPTSDFAPIACVAWSLMAVTAAAVVVTRRKKA